MTSPQVPAPTMCIPVPVTLASRHVRLEPLTAAMTAEIFAAGHDPRIWAHSLSAPLDSLAVTQHYVERALQEQEAGHALPFVIRAVTGEVLGMTRYMELAVVHGGLEIGHTWLVPAAWRTAVNTGAKRLLLAHAFEDLSTSRVSFKTDLLNERSQRAIERLGAVKEGVLRAHRRRADGTLRDTVYYSVLAAEWPAVRLKLDQRLGDPA